MSLIKPSSLDTTRPVYCNTSEAQENILYEYVRGPYREN